MPKLENRELATLLDAHRRDAVGFFTDEVSDEQDQNLQRYLGEPYGDEVDGRSQVISEDSAQVVDWALPDILEPFIAGEAVVEFEPGEERDEAWTGQATSYVNFVFWKDNPGFEILHSAAKDGLIQKVGITKAVWRQEERVERDTMSNLSVLAFNELEQDGSIRVVSVESKAVDLDQLGAAAAAFPDGLSHTVEIERTINKGHVSIEPIPPERFKIARRSASLRDTPYCSHEENKSIAELIEMGFDEDIVMKLPSGDDEKTATRRDTRFEGENRDHTGEQPHDPKAREVLLLEEYVRLNWDSDDDLDWIQVFRVGHQILEEPTEVDGHPFEAFCPYPMPHRFYGQSLVDKTKQTQRVNTVLTRQMLDNIYLASNPQREVAEDAVLDDGSTYDDLLHFRVGGLVRTKKFGQIREIGIADRSATALQGLSWFDQVREKNTGVTRGAIGLSAETIDKDQPVSAYEARSQDRGQQKRTRLMTRVFAETYLVPLFRKVLRLVVKHQDFERTIRLAGEFVPMDPRHWKADVDATINVGLGFPNREDELTGANVVLGLQREALEIGLTTPKRLFNTAERIVKAAGMGDVDRFFVDPESQEFAELQAAQAQQPEAPDPRLMEAQQRNEIRLLEVEQRAQMDQLKLQADVDLRFAEIEAKTATDREKAAADLALKREKIVGELAAAQDRMIGEFTLAREKLIAEIGLKREEIAVEAELARETNQARINGSGGLGGGVRFGGDIG